MGLKIAEQIGITITASVINRKLVTSVHSKQRVIVMLKL